MFRFLALVAALLAVVIEGCGSDAPSPQATGTTRTVVDARGAKLAVPATPQRVIALSEPTLDGALALGLKPIATTAGRGQTSVPGYLRRRAAGITSVGALGQPDLERVALLRPDLILVDGTSIQDGPILDKLRAIAPTVFVSTTGESWRTAFAAEAQALGRGAQGTRLLAAFDARAGRIRDALGANAGAEISVVRWSGLGLPATLKGELAVSRVLAQLGLTRPTSQRGRGPGHSVPISLENLDQLDAGWIFFAALGSGGPGSGGGGSEAESTGVAASRAALDIAREQPGFDRLSAVRDGHVIAVDGSAWGSAGGLLAEQVVLDDVERTLGSAAR